MLVAACLKWTDLRPEVDALSGAVTHDPRSFGLSAADQAALEWALRLGEAWSAPVWALSAGPPAAESGLRDALAAGAARAVRVAIDDGAPSEAVAGALAHALGATRALVVCCGDASVDRGSGAVPAFVAARLGASQALGLVDLAPEDAAGTLVVERRLERGRRERLVVRAPAVVSVEGGSARLRRAALPRVLEAARAEVGVVAGPAGGSAGTASWPAASDGGSVPRSTSGPQMGAGGPRVERRGPFRPRPRRLPAPDPASPTRSRILALTGVLVERTPPRTVRASPDDAAQAIVDQLRVWGYLE